MSILDFLKQSIKSYNSQGYDERGYDRQGYDRSGYDEDGYDKQGFDRDGYDRSGFHRETHLDRDGRDANGFDKNGYDQDGFNSDGYDRDGYDRQGLSKDTVKMIAITFVGRNLYRLNHRLSSWDKKLLLLFLKYFKIFHRITPNVGLSNILDRELCWGEPVEGPHR